jgi:hypothetical protein
MKRIIYLLAIIWISQVSYSQSDFRDGFILTQNRDTTFGQIKYKEGNSNYYNCEFKESGSGNIIIYKASDILGYGFKNDRYFESRKIDTDNQNSETVFLEVLIHGKVSLYKYDKVFYIEKAEYGVLKLTNKSVESSAEGGAVVSQSNSYLGVLNLFLSDCAEVIPRVPRTAFSEKPLTDLIVTYNKSMNSAFVIYKSNKPWVHVRFGVAAGYISSLVTLESSTDVFDHLGPFKRSNSPLFGGSIDLLFPRTNERWSLHSDILFTKSGYDSYNEKTLFGTTTKNWATIDMTQLKIPIGIRYTIQGKKVSPFFNAGLSETFTMSSSSDWTQTVFHGTYSNTDRDEALAISKTQPGFWGGAGLMTSFGKAVNAYIEFRYEKTDGINAEDFLAVTKANVTSFQFIIGLTSK